MRQASAAGPASPLGLRLLHLIVFLGFAGCTLSIVSPELSQLIVSQRAEYHFGDPPRGLPLLAGGLVLPGLGTLLVRFARGRSAPLWASVVLLAAAVLAMASMAFGELPRGRTWAAADVQILDRAREFQKRMLERLKVVGRLPADEAAWQQALAESSPPPSPVRTRHFDRVPYRIALQREQDRVPERLAPATLLVWVAPGGDRFEITPVGFARDGAVALLRDEKGEKVVLAGGLESEKEGAPP